MKQLVFATHNAHKLEEVQAMMPEGVQLLSLQDIGCTEEIPETGHSLEENAAIKARHVYFKHGLNCFADDTGLEADALNGQPGVYSARYAGAHGDSQANMEKLLSEMQGKGNRAARFRTVVCLILAGNEYYFNGIAPGTLLEEKRGEKGFGYDPIFQPLNEEKTFAEMSLEEKNKISHRFKAIRQLSVFLENMD